MNFKKYYSTGEYKICLSSVTHESEFVRSISLWIGRTGLTTNS